MESNPGIEDLNAQEDRIVARFNERFQPDVANRLLGYDPIQLLQFFETNPSEVLDELMRWVRKSLPESYDLVSIRYGRVAEMLRRGMANEAVGEYEAIINESSSHLEAWIYKAGLLAELGRIEEALLAANTAIQLTPDQSLAFFNRGIIYAKLQRYSDALADFQHSTEIDPDFAAGYAAQADMLSYLDKMQEAFDGYSLAIERTPKNAEFYYKRSIILVKSNQLSKALDDLKIAVSLEPANSEYRRQKDLLEVLINTPDDREKRKVKPSNPQESQSTEEMLGYYHLQNNNHKNAKYYFREALRKNPHNLVFFPRLSKIMIEDEETDQLEELIFSLISENLDIPQALLTLSFTLYLVGQFGPALETLNRAMELDPTDGHQFVMRAAVYIELGDTQRANADLAHAKELGVVFPDKPAES